MKIYILKEYNTKRTFCVSENIYMIKKCLLNKDYFNREYNDYPILIIWKNGEEIEHIYGNDVYKRVLNQLYEKQEQIMEKNYELELYKLIVIPDEDDRDILYVNEFGWVNNNEFCIWVNISIIDDFIEKLKDIFGYSFFDDGGIEASIGCDDICVNLTEACDRYDVNLEQIFPKDKYTH